MRFISSLVSLVLPLAAVAHKLTTISNLSIYDPPADYNDPQVLYARPLELSDGTLLATWENYSPEPPMVYFPIFKSTDGGKKWKEISKVTDQVNGWGLRYQPFLYELPQRFGKYPKGTILLSGSSIPTDLSQTLIEVYASRDKGYTWEFVSHVALGGEALPNHGLTPVWEPFLMTYKEKLVLYYSDQRDNATHSQKMVHQTTTDLKKWSAVVDDVAYENYYARPGMPTVAKLPNGEYIFAYEYGGEPSQSAYWFPVYYRISKDPLNFSAAEHHRVDPINGATPAGSPYVVWSKYGGKNGTIVINGASNSEIYTNQKLGHPAYWKKWSVPQPNAYTRALMVFKEDPDMLMIMGGGYLPPGKTNEISLSVVRLSEIMKE